MAKNKKYFFVWGLFAFSLVFFVLNVGSVSATFAGCWANSGTSLGVCQATEGCVWRTQANDPWCMNSAGCCIDLNCGMYGGNQAACTNSSDTLNCTWDSWMTYYYPNGTQGQGGCYQEWVSGGGGSDWGGFAEGCWQYDGDQASCNAQSGGTCKWTANNQNQNPWCMIKTLTDAQYENPSATSVDVGCCETNGCWSLDGNETSCNSAFQGNCFYTNDSFGSSGWCNTKSCSQIATQGNCTYAKQSLMMPIEKLRSFKESMKLLISTSNI